MFPHPGSLTKRGETFTRHAGLALRRSGLVLLLLLAVLVALRPEPTATSAQSPGFTFALAVDQRNFAGPGTYDSPSYFRGAVEAIQRLGGATFMLGPGDVDPPGASRYTLDQVLGSGFLWYPAVGNHEAETAEDMAYLRAYNLDPNGPDLAPNILRWGPSGCPTTTYSFDYGNAHFAVLNVYCNTGGDTATSGDIPDHLYDWLAADLAATTQQHIFVVGHEPAYVQPDGYNGRVRHLGDSLDAYPAHRDRFWNLLKSRGVVAYFTGHTHNYSAVQVNGVWQVDGGHARGAGDTLAPSTFVMIHVNGDTVTFDTYREIFDGVHDYDDIVHHGTLTGSGPVPTVAPAATATPAGGATTPSATATPAGGAATLSFQDGVAPSSGYSGTRDAHLSEAAPTTNYGSAATLLLDGDDPGGSGKDLATMIRWDVSQIPAGSRVESATIAFYVTNASGTQAYEAYEMLRGWVETQATWNSWAGGSNWQTAGARGPLDRGTTVLGAASASATGSRQFSLNAAGIALVQSWVDDPAANRGIILADGGNSDGLDFTSSEGTTVSRRPRLTVTYRVGMTTSGSLP